MAELTPKTVNELPSASSLQDTDLFPISSGGSAKKTLWSVIKTAIASAFFPLSIANGGTGATTAAAARAALGAAEPNESAIGYCKMPDGTLIQWGTFTENMTNGQLAITRAFPVAFVDTNYHVAACNVTSSATYVCSFAFTATATTACTMLFALPLAQTYTGGANFSWMAVGRWK